MRSVVTPRIAYAGSGGSGPFSVPFYFENNDHISVYLIDSESTSTLLVRGTDYTLAGAGTATGSVTTIATVDTGETLVIYRTTPLEQDTDLVTNGTFNSTVVEDAFDKILDQVQELETRANFFNLPLSGLAPTDATIAGKYLKINSAGTALEAAEGVDVSALTPGINCIVIATSNITLSGTQTIDGVALSVGNIVLVQNQTTKANNGVYLVASGAWTRHTDHDDTDGLQANTSFGITSGTVYTGTIWVQLVLDPDVGTDDIVFGRLGAQIESTNVLIGNGGTINFNSGDVLLTHSANALAMTGGQLTITYGAAATSEPLRLVNTTDNASVQVAQFEGDRATPAANDEVYGSWLLSDSGGTQTEFARITVKGTTVTDASEAGRLQFGVMTAGSLADELYLTGTALSPAANAGLALGTTALGFNGLHLGTGTAINWANGEILITESANALAVTGGSLSVTDSTAFTTPAGRFVNSTDSSAVLALNIEGDRATPTNDDSVVVHFKLSDSAGNQDTFAAFQVVATDVASGSEDGTLVTYVAVAGTNTAKLSLTGTTLSPFANDGLALGTTTEGFADLHLATGGVINWNNGDVLATHSANALAFTGASSGYTFDAQVVASSGAAASTSPARFVNTTDNSTNTGLRIESDRATPANNDNITAEWRLSDSAGNQDVFGQITVYAADVTSGSEDGFFMFAAPVAGAITPLLYLNAAAVFPGANDLISLGAASTSFSDLFLASGGVVNWNNGAVTLTQSGELLTLVGELVINRQLSADTESAIVLASSDVTHGVTSVMPTNSYARFTPVGTSAGGLQILTAAENANVTAFKVLAVGDTDTTKSTAGTGVVSFEAYENDGTATPAAMTADSNILVIRSGTTTRFIFDTEGTFHADVGSTTYDHLDDLATLNALDYHRAAPDDPIKQKFQEWMLEKRETLEKHKLIKFNEDGHHFVAVTRLTMLHTGAIRQLGEKLAERETQIAALERRLQAIEKKS